MKKTIKLLLILSFVALFALPIVTFAACKTTVDPKLSVTVLSNADVKVDDSLESVKQYLSVKYTDSDNKTFVVTDYELQGTLTEGQTTLTVKYQGLTVTCKITVKANSQQDVDTPTKPTITISANGGTFVGSITVNDDNTLTEPSTPPTRDNYKFLGWYKDKDCTVKWNFQTDKVTEDITLYAKWEALVLTVGLDYKLNNDGNSYSVSGRGTVDAKDIVIPSTYNGKSVSAIGESAFKDCADITSVIIPACVTTIDNSAFCNCTKLQSVQWNTMASARTSTQGRIRLKTPLRAAEAENENEATIGLNSFYNCSSLTSVIIPDNVTVLKGSSFEGCTSLTSVTIPSGVTSIIDSAFKDCTNLETVFWKAVACKYAGSDAFPIFKNCNKLTTVILDDNVTAIGDNAFYGCDNLQYNEYDDALYLGNENNPNVILVKVKDLSISTFVIKENTKCIYGGAFRNCGSLASLTLPSTLTFIGGNAFRNCNALSRVDYLGDMQGWCNVCVPDNDYDGHYANPLLYGAQLYQNGVLVTEVEIPDSVKEVNAHLFAGCTSITSVIMHDGVVSISDCAFYGCSNIANIAIPNSVIAIGNGAFDGCEALRMNEYDNALYLGDENNHNVVLIKAKDTNISMCEIDSNTKFIYNNAFDGCRSLSDVVIPEGLIKIHDYAFNDCDGLTSIVIPNSVNSIGKYAFNNCGSLTTLTIGENVELIDWCAFRDCTSLKTVNWNTDVCEEVTYNGHIFMGCYNLTTVIIGDNVTSIAKYAFFECVSLRDVTIGSNVALIGDGAFDGCRSLTSITIPANVKQIGNEAFSNCNMLLEVYNLSTLDIVASTIDNGYVAYYAKDVYTTLDQPSRLTVTDDGYVFVVDDEQTLLLGCVGDKTELVLPDTFNGQSYVIYPYAFYNSRNLTKVKISDGVTSIGSCAFRDCSSLMSVTLGANVASVEDSAFDGCTKLVEIYNLSGLNVTAGASDYGYLAYNAQDVYTETNTASKLTVTDDGYVFYASDSVVYLLGYMGSEAELTLPDSFNGRSYAIYKSAFCENFSITKVTMSDGVTSIGDWSFTGAGLVSVTIGKNVTSIGEVAFVCANLAEIKFDGTTAQWELVTKQIGCFMNTAAEFIECSDGRIYL